MPPKCPIWTSQLTRQPYPRSMTRVVAVLAGTEVIPKFGWALLDESDLQRMAEKLRGQQVPMHVEHDLDNPIEMLVVSADVRDAESGHKHLVVEYEVSDEVAAQVDQMRGMSIGFAQALYGPEDPTTADSAIYLDPASYSRAELAVASQRLNRAGFTPISGVYYQLAVDTVPVVVFDFLTQLPAQLGWAVVTGAIIEGLRILVRQGEPSRYRFRLRRSGNRELVAEVETSSERAFREAVRALRDLDDKPDGTYIRDISSRQWRMAGKRKRKRRRRK